MYQGACQIQREDLADDSGIDDMVKHRLGLRMVASLDYFGFHAVNTVSKAHKIQLMVSGGFICPIPDHLVRD